MHIILTGKQRIQELPDNTHSRIAGIVVGILQACLHNIWTAGLQQFHMVAIGLGYLCHQLEMHGQHIGHKDCVVPLHLLSEGDVGIVMHAVPPPPVPPAGCGDESAQHPGW